MVAGLAPTGTINVPRQDVQHNSARVEQVILSEGSPMLPYTVLSCTQTPQYVFQYSYDFFPFTALRDRHFVLQQCSLAKFILLEH